MRFKIPIIITPAKKTVPTGNKSVKRRKKFRNEKKGQPRQETLPALGSAAGRCLLRCSPSHGTPSSPSAGAASVFFIIFKKTGEVPSYRPPRLQSPLPAMTNQLCF